MASVIVRGTKWVEVLAASLQSSARIIADSRRSGGRLFWWGSGGQIAACQTGMADLEHCLSTTGCHPQPQFIPLRTVNIPHPDLLTLIALPIKRDSQPGDVFVGVFSCERQRDVQEMIDRVRAVGVRTVIVSINDYNPISADAAIYAASTDRPPIGKVDVQFILQSLGGMVERELDSASEQPAP
ncbi:MAG: hypothetical protein ACKV0T_08200 [Planctomycetales bacterium]